MYGTYMFRKIGEAILDFVYPRSCVGCQKSGAILCQDCYAQIDFYTMTVRLRLEPRYIDEYQVVARLEHITRTMIHQLKYNGIKELSQVLGDLLYQSSEWPEADLVTAVPLHPNRLGERGFNQAELIARQFSLHAQLPYVETLRRTADTPHQAQQLTRADREQNIIDYFALLNPENTSLLVDKHILIIDDVCTTGITLNHCAKVLKTAGCSRVTALTFAHGR